jgi:hypothetical protein
MACSGARSVWNDGGGREGWALGRAWRGGLAAALIGLLAGLALPSTAGSATLVGAGSGWSVQRTPSPRHSPQSQLMAVSCPSARACVAVGEFNYVPLIERWNGTRWDVQAAFRPPQATFSELDGVSCASTRMCIAVGYRGENALVERWNGRKWTREATPAGGKPGSDLDGVSCTSASSCTAAGFYYPHSNSLASLAERWNGRTWKLQRTPNPSGEGAFLAVSCASAKACTAVGVRGGIDLNNGPLAERYNGTKWVVETTPDPNSQLTGVSCASASSCTAVGYTYTSTQVTFAEQWDGHDWTIQPTPNDTQPDNQLNAVSCASPSACTAVGRSGNPFDGPLRTLAERWNGSTWTLQSTPTGNRAIWFLMGVACPTVHACTAIGSHHPGLRGHALTLAERWTG